MQIELKRSRFEDGLEGVLELINSVNLTDMLQAADEDIAMVEDLSLHDRQKAEEEQEAGNRRTEEFLQSGAAANV